LFAIDFLGPSFPIVVALWDDKKGLRIPLYKIPSKWPMLYLVEEKNKKLKMNLKYL
jgi:hypothetical protein